MKYSISSICVKITISRISETDESNVIVLPAHDK
jgi:hypothetical protein